MNTSTPKNLTNRGKKIMNYFSTSILKSKIDDQEYDRLLNESVQILFPKALQLVSLDPQDCIHGSQMIISPPDFKSIGSLQFETKKGGDNYLRYYPIGITIYNFTNHSLIAYQCTFDPTTDNALNESTFEYFYNDIVSFETITKSGSTIDYDWKEKIIKHVPILKSIINTGKIYQYDFSRKFVLTTKGGSKISVILSDHILKEATNGGEFRLTKALKSIAVVRRIIRDKKSYSLA